MRLAVVIALAVGCSSSKPAPDAEDIGACEVDFQAVLVRTCTQPTDCVLLDHLNCCGIIEIGVAASAQASAEAAESHYQACRALACLPGGCAAQTKAEDGQVPNASQMIVATCSLQRCTSIVR